MFTRLCQSPARRVFTVWSKAQPIYLRPVAILDCDPAAKGIRGFRGPPARAGRQGVDRIDAEPNQILSEDVASRTGDIRYGARLSRQRCFPRAASPAARRAAVDAAKASTPEMHLEHLAGRQPGARAGRRVDEPFRIYRDAEVSC
jgi:hypothetical protein